MKAITTTYYGPTNAHGSRILARDADNNRAMVTYDDALNRDQNHQAAVLALCHKMNWHGTLVQGSLGVSEVFVWDRPDLRLEVK